MNDLNSVFMVGRLVEVPELSKENEESLIRFQILNSYLAYDEKKAEYTAEPCKYNVALYGKMAEKLQPVLKKGLRIGVNGRLRGTGKEGLVILAFTVQILDKV